MPSAEAAGELVAGRVLDRLAAIDGELLVGCPSGRTPTTTYAALRRSGVDLSRLVVVLVDEFLVDGALCDPSAHFSCRRYVAEHLPGLRVLLPDPAVATPHLDVFLLASGASDGHVAFNPPGTPIGSGTRVVELAETTRRDNLATFPGFGSIDEVPTHGVSLGLAAVVDADEVIGLLLGADKAAAVRRLLATDRFDPAWPATVLHACANATLVVDELAVG